MADIAADLYSRAAGIDIHQSLAVVSVIVPVGDGSQCRFVRGGFDTFTGQGLKALVPFPAPFGVEIVLMESTGVYWMSACDALLEAGVSIAVANAREIKGMRGRKTDRKCRLARQGCQAELLPSVLRSGTRTTGPALSFVACHKPEDCVRRREEPARQVASAAGYRLNTVFTDMYGLGGMLCVRGILDGGKPAELPGRLPGRAVCRHSREEMLPALGGKFEEPDLTAAKAVLEHIDYLEAEIGKLVASLQELVGKHDARKRELLQTMPGVDAHAASIIMSEAGGGGLEAFDSAEALCAWAGAAPGQNESAGKKKSAKTRKGSKALRRVVCECAQAAARTKKTTLQSKFQSLMQRGKGYKKSIMAIGRKILTYVYYVLKNDKPYVDPQIDYQKERMEKLFRRFVAQLRHCMQKYDIQIINKETGESI